MPSSQRTSSPPFLRFAYREELLGLRTFVVAFVAVCAGVSLAWAARAEAAPVTDDAWPARVFASEASAAAAGGVVTASDLVRLRDLGSLSLSPDGRWLAFSIRQPTRDLSDYAVRWFVMSTSPLSTPLPLQLGPGQPIRSISSGLPFGYVPPDPAKWSPDSKHLAIRRRAGDRIELWVLAVDSGAPRRVSDGVAQVDAFEWARAALVFRTGLNVASYRSLVADEARHGWLLDSRMGALWAARTPSPLPPDCRVKPTSGACDVRVYALSADGELRIATPDESARLSARNPLVYTSEFERRDVANPDAVSDARAWAEVVEPAGVQSFYPLRRIRTNVPASPACNDPACSGTYIREVGFARSRRSVWFIKRVSSRSDQRGPFDQYGVYEWRLEPNRVTSVLRGDDVVEDCHATWATLFCRRSSTTAPSHVVAIDLDSSTVRVVADPNPEFGSKIYPRVANLPLEDPAGNRGFARLVYPNGYQPGRRYPLVVVTYRSQGFLRGGTSGDEYPIFPLAAEGFFVLSIDKPVDEKAMRGLSKMDALRQRRSKHREHDYILAAIDRTVDHLIADGLVDRKRLAITGLSFGAELVHAALRRSDRYAAAVASQGAVDLTYFAQFPDDGGRADWMAMRGEAELIPGPGSEIPGTAWSQHPDRLRTPLLLNLGQNEALFGFEGFAVLRHKARPLEVRVFPDEGHIKYAPQSFAGVYENNLMWLRFWLLGVEDMRPEFASQYLRWRKMRDLHRLDASARHGDALASER